MDPHEELDTLTAPIREFARVELRKKCLHLSETALQMMLDQMISGLRNNIIKERPAMEASKARTSFFKLPRELRDVIYEYAFDLHASRDRPYTNIKDFKKAPPVAMQVCRQFREEIAALYCGRTNFQLSFSGLMTLWMPPEDFDALATQAKKWLQFIGPVPAYKIPKLFIGPIISPREFARQVALKLGEPLTEGNFGFGGPLYPVNKNQVVKALGLEGTGLRIEALELGYCPGQALPSSRWYDGTPDLVEG